MDPQVIRNSIERVKAQLNSNLSKEDRKCLEMYLANLERRLENSINN
jgi:hypothetical protein